MSMWYSIALGHHEQPAKAAMEKKVGTPRAAVSPRACFAGRTPRNDHTTVRSVRGLTRRRKMMSSKKRKTPVVEPGPF